MALGKTVGELLDGITSSEFTEWLAFAQLEPFGGMIEDMRAGLYPAMKASSEEKVIGPLDFFPWHKTPPEDGGAPPTAEALLPVVPFDPSSSGQAEIAGRILSLSSPG